MHYIFVFVRKWSLSLATICILYVLNYRSILICSLVSNKESTKHQKYIQRKKFPNLGWNSWFCLPGSYRLTIRLSDTRPKRESATSSFSRACDTFPFGRVPDSLMVKRYEPGRENHEFNSMLGNFFPWGWKKKWRLRTEYLLTKSIVWRGRDVLSSQVSEQLGSYHSVRMWLALPPRVWSSSSWLLVVSIPHPIKEKISCSSWFWHACY